MQRPTVRGVAFHKILIIMPNPGRNQASFVINTDLLLNCLDVAGSGKDFKTQNFYGYIQMLQLQLIHSVLYPLLHVALYSLTVMQTAVIGADDDNFTNSIKYIF